MTSALITVKDDCEEFKFYRHSDGYPEMTLLTLNKFLDLVKSRKIRKNANQSAGWLIIIGHEELKEEMSKCNIPSDIYGWKASTYELTNDSPATCYTYVVDLIKETISVQRGGKIGRD